VTVDGAFLGSDRGLTADRPTSRNRARLTAGSEIRVPRGACAFEASPETRGISCWTLVSLSPPSPSNRRFARFWVRVTVRFGPVLKPN